MKVICNKNNTQWCNEVNYENNNKCPHSIEHDKIGKCKRECWVNKGAKCVKTNNNQLNKRKG